MKKNAFLWGMLAAALTFAMTAVGCGNDPGGGKPDGSDPGGDTPTGVPAAKGKLTINGLGSFNDKYVYVSGLAGSSTALFGLTDITGAPSDITYKLAKIANGKAEVPLYTSSGSSYTAYGGNDTISSVNIIILSDSTLKASNVVGAVTNNLGMKTLTTGTFTNGNMTVEWGPGGNGGGGTAGETTSSNGIVMVSILGGTFTMGSPANETNRNNDETQHSVTLSSFKIGKYQVTQEQYQAVTGSNPSSFISAVPGESGTPGKLPVENVTWYDAVEFCNKLSVLEGLQAVYTISGRTPATGYPITGATVTADFSRSGYRLPTEAQWEFACRAGTTTAYSTGATITTDQAWYYDNSGFMTHQVGLKPANAWGLYDMHGNVLEWCWDWYGNYQSGAQTDPVGVSSGSERVARGSCWGDSAEYLRSAFRDYGYPYDWGDLFGFRLVRP